MKKMFITAGYIVDNFLLNLGYVLGRYHKKPLLLHKNSLKKIKQIIILN